MNRTMESREAPPGVKDLFAVLARRKWLILLVALPVIAASVLYTYSRTPTYSASVGILVRPALTSLTIASRSPELDGQTESNLATSVAVATLAGELMGSPESPQQLLKHVSANMVNGTQFLTIAFTGSDPATTQRGAEAFGEAYLSYRQEQAQGVIQQQTDAINEQLAEVGSKLRAVSEGLRRLSPDSPSRLGLQSRRDVLSGSQLFLQNQLVTLLSITTDPGEVIDPAILPSSPSAPRHEFDILIGIVLGFGLGFAAALIKERSSDSVRSPIEMEERLGIPVLGAIPRARRLAREKALVVTGGQRTITADAFRRLRTGLLGIASPTDKVILVTSANSGEGKTATVANLGAALAEIGRRVIVVSADLRKPGLQDIFGDGHLPGLQQGLADGLPAKDLVHHTSTPNLRSVPAGAGAGQVEPVNLLQSDRMRELLDTWKDDADFILVDSPPVLGVPDSLVLARVAGGILFVADVETSRWDDVVSAHDELERAGGVLTAGVLNGVSVSRRDRRAWKARGVATPSRTANQSRAVKRPESVRQEL